MQPVVFSAAWFAQHQRTLLWLLHAPIIGRWFRWVLCIRPHDVGYRGRIVQLLPHAYIVDNGDGTFTMDCRTHAKYAKRLHHVLWPLWAVLHAWDTWVANPLAPALNAGFDTLTLYPDPGDPGTTTADSNPKRAGVDETWASIVGGAGVGNDQTSSEAYIYAVGSTTADQFSQLWRYLCLFDTSGVLGTVTAATLSFYGRNILDGLGQTSLDVVACSPASNTSLSASDYGSVAATVLGSIAYGSFAGATYNAVSLPTTAIAVGGVTKLAARLGWDTSGTFGGTWVSGGQTFFVIATADWTASTNDPKLEVTYTPAVGFLITLLGTAPV